MLSINLTTFTEYLVENIQKLCKESVDYHYKIGGGGLRKKGKETIFVREKCREFPTARQIHNGHFSARPSTHASSAGIHTHRTER